VTDAPGLVGWGSTFHVPLKWVNTAPGPLAPGMREKVNWRCFSDSSTMRRVVRWPLMSKKRKKASCAVSIFLGLDDADDEEA